MTQWVYSFGSGVSDGDASMKALLGGKGANLAEMASLGLPVPPGYTITTDACTAFYTEGQKLPEGAEAQAAAALKAIEDKVVRKFGDPGDPLLVSVRSGAPVSMPGMMDTVLNLGLNDETVAGLVASSGDERFAWDSYRRFIQMYSDVVLELDHNDFEDILDDVKGEEGVFEDAKLNAEALQAIVARYRALVEDRLGRPFPQDPCEQLWGAIRAVFASWHNQRAIDYRRIHEIPDNLGTAVNVQAMVFGNMGTDCATGVAFTRNPDNGANEIFGEFLVNAQGEDVVAGIRTPQPIRSIGEGDSMEEVMPRAFAELMAINAKLERHYRDMQDVEFTIEKDRLFMLQTRAAKRGIRAALKIAVDMADEGLISREDAVCRIDPKDLDRLLHPVPDPKAPRKVIAKGLPGSPGAASGMAVFNSDDAQAMGLEGKAVILVRPETSPEDIHGMHAAKGILTKHGGQTSHAALVARGMGRPCVTGCGSIRVDPVAGTFGIRDITVHRGDIITIDGSTGEVILGEVPTIEPELSAEFDTLMAWADEVRELNVRANAETPADAAKAREFGAEGIGLCRTEHMFFEDERIIAMREMIMAEDEAGRREPLQRILPMQREDFTELFRIMAGLPITIRLLDPPLHEFLPVSDQELEELARHMGADVEHVRIRAGSLRELNPMLGHRGCRLGISHPEIYDIQARAILEAAVEAEKKEGEPVLLEIMVPLVATKRELDIIRGRIETIADEVRAETGGNPNYMIGTMIELPRAALRAGEIAESADFFSFGTNDLTQTTYGISRDDPGRFLESYQEHGVFEVDPFISLDVEGVGELVEIATARGRATRPDLKLGICGEHGGDPASIAFCQQTGLDYVSCSPYRVPIARLAAAQAAIRQKG
ncbi:MAG: pyruvate, phosphate dikinase [Rhodospirillaceae bacterium]|nr:pyruvate, phosphate dikinase [Rhodospirillaceae bacterium]